MLKCTASKNNAILCWKKYEELLQCRYIIYCIYLGSGWKDLVNFDTDVVYLYILRS